MKTVTAVEWLVWVKKQKMIKKLLCFFGFHKWKNIDDYFPIPKDGEMICFQNLHECKNCKKQEYKGMGCII
jgi:hypothetical protein